MANSFLELLEQLRNTTDSINKINISSQMSNMLADENGQSVRFMYSVFNYINPVAIDPVFPAIMDGEFYQSFVRAYTDNDGKTKVALGIAYLQDHKNVVLNLDHKVLKELSTIVENQNLELLVNDITVNMLQCRNGYLIT